MRRHGRWSVECTIVFWLLSVGNTSKADRACALPSLAHQRVFAVRVCPVRVREVVARRGDRRRQRRAAGPNQILQQMLSSRADAHGQQRRAHVAYAVGVVACSHQRREWDIVAAPFENRRPRVLVLKDCRVPGRTRSISNDKRVVNICGQAHCHTLPTRLCTPNGDAPLGWASLSSGPGQPRLVLAQ